MRDNLSVPCCPSHTSPAPSDEAAASGAVDACSGGNMELDGRPVRVKLDRGAKPSRAEPKEENSSGLAVYVNNLPWTTTSEELQGIYGAYQCLSAEVQLRNDGKSAGYGIVKFETADLASAAIEATHGTELGGRQLFARLDKYS